MSEKHLTEQPWKVLAAKQGVKDIGLLKALGVYCKLDGTKQPGEALEALKEISEFAVKLKKANPAKEEVVAHLDEVVKEVKKTTPGLEARLKTQAAEQVPQGPPPAKPAEAAKPAEEDPAEALDAAAFKQDMKRQMMSALAQVKARASGEPEQEREPKPQLKFMVCLAGTNCSVVVARLVGAATKKLLSEIGGVASGGKFIQGECIFEKNSHTFVFEEVPSGVAKKLAAALHTQTGQKYKVRVRNTDGSVDLDADADLDPAAPAASSPTPAASSEETTRFTARLRTLQPDMLKAIGTKTPQSEEIKRRAAEAGALANQKDFAAAHRKLDGIDGLVKQALTANVTPTPPAGPPPPSTPKATMAPAPTPTADPAAPKRSVKLSTYLTGRANLRTARENATKELQRLQQVILAKASDEPFLKEIEAKTQKLFEYLAPIDDSVANQLDDAGRCTDPERQDELNKKVRDLIQKQLSSLRDHPLAGFVQSNPFGKFIIRQPLEVTLAALEKQLA